MRLVDVTAEFPGDNSAGEFRSLYVVLVLQLVEHVPSSPGGELFEDLVE